MNISYATAIVNSLLKHEFMLTFENESFGEFYSPNGKKSNDISNY